MTTSSVVWGRAASIIVCSLLSVASAFAQAPFAGPNVNMVSEAPFLRQSPADTTKTVVKWNWPYNDVFLTKQNEPSIAVSSLNPDHLLAGANDYRFVDPMFTGGAGDAGDAWVQLYGSVTGGRTWFSFPVAGCPYKNVAACNDPATAAIQGLQAGADPTVRAGPYGTFFVSFIAFNRGTNAGGVTAVRRYVDKNNKLSVNVDPSNPADNPIAAEAFNIIDTGTAGQFKDKPWNIAGVPGSGGTLGLPNCAIGGRSVAAFPVYVVYSNFTGQGQNQHPAVYVAVSTNCGDSFAKGVKLSNSLQASQGGTIAIDPKDGTPYVAWRVFGDPTSGQADAIYYSKQTSASKNQWSSPQLVTNIKPFDQPSTAGSIRTLGFPTMAISVDSSNKSWLHIAWAERKGTVDANFNCVQPDTNLKCDARIKLATLSLAPGNNSWQFKGVDDAFPDTVTGAANGRGHQIQPALTFAGGKLLLVWLDQRLDQTVGVISCNGVAAPYNAVECPTKREAVANRLAGQTDVVFTPLIYDGTTGLTRRHTLDIYAAMADPGAAPSFASSRVSQYEYGTARPTVKPYKMKERHWNVVGLPIFAGDTRAFLGDYLDVAAQTIFASGGTYQWNTGWNSPGCGNATTACRTPFHAAWTDNRDIVVGTGPHTPTNLLTVSPDGSTATVTANQACMPGQNGSRNQNIYTAVISDTAVPYTSNNSKQFNTADPRGVIVGVQNLSTSTQTFTLQIHGATATTPPAGYTYASFDADPTHLAVPNVTLTVAPRATATRSVWFKTSTVSAPTVTIDVFAGSAATGTPLQQIVLNPDPAATQVANTGWDGTSFTPGASDLANNDMANAVVKTLDFTNSDMTNAGLAALDLTNLDMANLDMTNLDMTNLDMANSDLTNSDLTNLDMTNSDMANLDLTNLDLTNSDMANLDLMNLDFTNSDLTNLDFTNLDLTNLDLTNNTFADSTSAVTNKGNTDTTLGVKLLTRGDGTDPKIQLVLRKTTLKPTIQPTTATACKIVGYQQTSQVASQPAACGPAPPAGDPDPRNPSACANNDTENTIGTFDPTNVSLLTLPLAAGEKAQLTVRVLSNQQDFANWGSKLVVTDAGNKTKTRIPLIIKTFTQHAPGLSSAPIQITAWGGYLSSGDMVWSLPSIAGVPAAPDWLSISGAGSSIPPGTNLRISFGNLVVKPGKSTVPGTYQFAVGVADQSTPLQTDVQRITLVVDQATSSTTLTSNPSTSTTYGNSVTLTATIGAPGAVNPPDRTGTVTFKDGATAVASVQILSASTATLSLSSLNAGPHSLTAVYSGDTTYQSSTSAAIPLTVNPAPQTVTIADPGAKIYGGPQFQLSASGSSSGNLITFALTSGTACSVSSTGLVTILAAGSCTVTATQAASMNYAVGTASIVITVSAAPLTIMADPETMVYGDSPATSTWTATYNGQSSPPAGLTGTLTFAVPAINGVGSYTITPSGLSSTNYAITYATGTLTVTPATTMFSNLSAPVIALGTASTTISGMLKYGSAIPSGGTVDVTLNGVKNSPTIDSSGNFSTMFTTTSLPLGSYTISFFFAGNSNFNAASASSTLRVEGFASTGSMTLARSYHTATRLNDGRVLIAGGFDASGAPTAASEIYCAVVAGNCSAGDVGNFKAVGNLPSKSAAASAALLDDGRVLSTGGGNSSAELFSPVTNAWTPASGMSSNRSYHTSSTVPGTGKVLIIGGADNSGKTLNTTIVYDVATSVFTVGPAMAANGGRERHTATVLPDGRILVAGGRVKQGNGYNALKSAEIYTYNSATQTFSVLAGPDMVGLRYSHGAALVNGQVVVAGGNNVTPGDVATAEIYTPATTPAIGSWASAGNLSAARRDVTLSGITGNRVLAAGGQTVTTPSNKADVFSGSGFSVAASLLQARTNHTSTTLLPDVNGVVRVLITGGVGTTGTLNSAELYNSAP